MARKTNSAFSTNKKWALIVGAVLVLSVAVFASLQISSQAASGVVSFEAESASLNGNAVVKSHSEASGGKHVEFPQ